VPSLPQTSESKKEEEKKMCKDCLFEQGPDRVNLFSPERIQSVAHSNAQLGNVGLRKWKLFSQSQRVFEKSFSPRLSLQLILFFFV
jgi:hypothetical protein